MLTFSLFFEHWVTLYCNLDVMNIKLWRFWICCFSLMTIVSFVLADTFLGLTWIGHFLSLAVVSASVEPCTVLGVEFGDVCLASRYVSSADATLSLGKTVETGTHLSEWTWASHLNPCTSVHCSVTAAGCFFVWCLGFRVVFYRKVVWGFLVQYIWNQNSNVLF